MMDTRDVSCCPFCPKQFLTEHLCYSHANRVHHDQFGDDWFKCEDCTRYFPDHVNLDRHKDSFHSRYVVKIDPETNTIPCPFCPMEVYQFNQFYFHVKHDHMDKILESWFPCDNCAKLYPSRSSMIRHQKAFEAEGLNCVASRFYLELQNEDDIVEESSMDKVRSCFLCNTNEKISIGLNISDFSHF